MFKPVGWLLIVLSLGVVVTCIWYSDKVLGLAAKHIAGACAFPQACYRLSYVSLLYHLTVLIPATCAICLAFVRYSRWAPKGERHGRP